jgi:hypothetical protein
MRGFRHLRAYLPALVLVLLAARPGTAPAAEVPACVQALVPLLDDDVTAAAAAPGAIITWPDGDGGTGAALWVGVLPSGMLVTNTRIPADPASTFDARSEDVRQAIERLDAEPTLRGCPPLRATVADIAGVGLAEAEAAVHPAPQHTGPTAFVPPTPPLAPGVIIEATDARHGHADEIAVPTAPLQRLAAWLPMLALLVYVLLQIVAAVLAVRREPRVALLVLLLAGGSIALRFLVAPRVPMVGQSSDLVPMAGALGWLAHSVYWDAGGLPPLVPGLLFLVLGVTGPSFEAAFATTTVLGGLVAVPTFAVGRRLGGSVPAGLLAGLAAATLPLGVIFSNGVNLEIPMALLLAAVMQHGLAWIDRPRPLDAARLVLALLLFAQSRPEALLDAPAVLAALLGVALASGRARALLVDRALWTAAAGALALALPFLWLTAHAIQPQHAAEATKELRLLAWVVPLLIVLGAAGGRAIRWAADHRALWGLLALGLVGLAVARMHATAVAEPAPVLVPSWTAALPLEPRWITAPVFTATYGSIRTTQLDNPWTVPLTWLVPAFLGVLASPRGTARRALVAAGLMLAALSLLRWQTTTTCLAKSGELIADGARYLSSTTGLLAMLIGVGAAHLVELLPRRRAWRLPAWLAAGAWMLSPLATHAAVMGDVRFDQQQRFQFVQETFPRLPANSLMLLADQLVYAEVPQAEHGGTAYDSSRTPTLLTCSRYVFGGPEEHLGLREWAVSGMPWPGDVVVFLDLDCYRTRDGLPDALCESLRAMPGLVSLGHARLTNRPWSRYPLSNVAEVELDVLQVPFERVADLRERILERVW